MIKLEICVFSISDVIVALQNGADRIELCASYLDGGITPSHAVIEKTLHLTAPENIVVMIRPRGGNFMYNDAELEMMKNDIDHCKSLGVQQVIFGAITINGKLDKETNKMLVQQAAPMRCTLQRAFDLTNDPFEALEDAIECGFQRILTSGQSPNAFAGKELIKQLIHRANGRITILPGAGITSSNAVSLIQFTGCSEIHASAKKQVPAMPGFREGIYDFSAQTMTNGEEVHALFQISRNYQ